MNKVIRCVKCSLINKNVGPICQFSTGAVYRDNISGSSHPKPGSRSVSEYYAGKSVFLTGATGFVGRVLIERLLFTCKNIEKLYVLIRAKDDASTQQRLQELLYNPIFTKLKETRPHDLNKIVPIAGDVSDHRLGISVNDEQTLIDKVSVIFHSAANVKFRAPLCRHMKVNYEGTKNVLELGTKMKNLDVFVYVSTVFHNSKDLAVDEAPCSPPRSEEVVYKVIANHGNDSKETKEILDYWGNSYIFSKKMAEAYVASEPRKFRRIIVRPSMVTSVYKEPVAGYTDSWVAGTGLLCDIASGLTRVVYGNKNVLVEMIPVDFVCNFLVVAAAKSPKSSNCNVYNCTTGRTNPISWKKISDIYIKESKKHGYGIMSYPSVYFTKIAWAIPLLIIPIQILPASIADILLLLTGKRPRFYKMQKRATSRSVFVKPVTSDTWDIKTSKARELISDMDSEDKNTFPCDPRSIEWDKYIPIYCKGVKDYMLGNSNKVK